MFAMKLKEGVTLYGNKAMAYGTVAGTAVGMVGLTVTSSGVTLDSADLATLTTANTSYLTTIFQVIQLLPIIAVIGGGTYLINKLFSIVPKAGSGK